MLYEVSTPAGSFVEEASCIFEAKLKVRQRFDCRSMQAKKIDVDYPEVIYRGEGKDRLQDLVDKDIIIYDEHHGTAVRIRKATVAILDHYLDEYSTVIIL